MAAKNKTKRKAKSKNVAKKTTGVNLIAEIDKIEADKPKPSKGWEIVNKAFNDLATFQESASGAEAKAARCASGHVKTAVGEFSIDNDKPYKTSHAAKMAALVQLFVRSSPGPITKAKFNKLSVGCKNQAEVQKALAFEDKVREVQNATPTKPKWNAELILEAVEKIPELLNGVKTKDEVTKLYNAAVKKKKKFNRKASAYVRSLWEAGKDKTCEIVDRYDGKHTPRPKSEIKSAIQRAGSAR
jgi:hypothetical protein